MELTNADLEWLREEALGAMISQEQEFAVGPDEQEAASHDYARAERIFGEISAALSELEALHSERDDL